MATAPLAASVWVEADDGADGLGLEPGSGNVCWERFGLVEGDFDLAEAVGELFAKVEEIDPTPKPETEQFDCSLDEENRIPETVQ